MEVGGRGSYKSSVFTSNGWGSRYHGQLPLLTPRWTTCLMNRTAPWRSWKSSYPHRVTDCSSPSSIVNQAVRPTINKVYDCYMKSPPGQRCFRSWLLGDPWESQLITWPGLQPKHPSPTPFPCSSPIVSKTALRVKALAAKHDDASSIPYGPMW